MIDRLLNIYRHLPHPFRPLAASLYGLHLRSWRYGPETDLLVAEALDRDTWSATRWRAWQEEQLAFVLHRAATQVPYYREQWSVRRRHGDSSSWEYLENWPILNKEAIRTNPHAFVATECNVRKMYHEHTSGTTGKALDLWWSKKTVRAWYALFEARTRRWNGVSRHDRWAILGGQLVTPVDQRRPPFWVWNAPMSQLYMSSYHLAPDLISHYLDALKRYRIRYMLGYTSSLYALADALLRQRRIDILLDVVLTNAEPVFAHQRKAIATAFGCPVRETYGMAEIVAAASECEMGRLHLWPEVGWVEVINGNVPVGQGESGDLVCTSLLNVDMPLVRYRVGDRGGLSALSRPCPCGRTLPELASIEGRDEDVLYTADGRKVGRLDPVFKTRLQVFEAQIIQEALDRIRVRYVPAPQFSPADADSIIERLRARLGPVEVILEAVPEVPRTANGKFRAVICNLPPEQLKSVVAVDKS